MEKTKMSELLAAYSELMKKMPKPNFAIVDIPADILEKHGIVPGDFDDDTDMFLELIRRSAKYS